METTDTFQAVATSTGMLPFFLTLFFAAGISLIAILIAIFIGPKKPSKEKAREYECGIRPAEPVHQRLDIHFFRMGILFLIFGAEIVFFFPWALALSNAELQSEKFLALGDMIVFAVILAAGFIFAWAKGAFLWWKPYGRTDKN